jgi:hypothetical protein
MWYVWGREEMRRGFWLGNTNKNDHLEEISVDGVKY